MDWAEELTAGNDRITLFVAFNYGGRAEIVDAARSVRGRTEEEFRGHLYAPEMHDPDLLIRTSGEQRISNFLLWQCAYSELVFRDELWPDFSREAFEASLDEFERAAALRRARTARMSPRRRAARRRSRPFDAELDFDQARRGRARRSRRRRCAAAAPRGATARPRRAAPRPRRETLARIGVGRARGSRSWSRSRSSAGELVRRWR